MPVICRFFGIAISMYFDDHAPPHFHARYGSDRALVQIDPPALLDGSLPPRALGLVIEWARLRRDALLDDWDRAHRAEPLATIEPLI